MLVSKLISRQKTDSNTSDQKRKTAKMAKAIVESAYNDLLENIKEMYMASDADSTKFNEISQKIIDSVKSDETTTDGFKNLLLARYKECVYEASGYPFFSYEDEFIMETLQSLIKANFGDEFFNTHRLEQTHWMFADGTYEFLFAPDFVETVY